MPNSLQLTIFRALANRRRLQLLELLLKQKEVSLKEAADAIKLSVKSTHKHLNQLVQAGFVVTERRGLLAYYWIDTQNNLAQRALQFIRK